MLMLYQCYHNIGTMCLIIYKHQKWCHNGRTMMSHDDCWQAGWVWGPCLLDWANLLIMVFILTKCCAMCVIHVYFNQLYSQNKSTNYNFQLQMSKKEIWWILSCLHFVFHLGRSFLMCEIQNGCIHNKCGTGKTKTVENIIFQVDIIWFGTLPTHD